MTHSITLSYSEDTSNFFVKNVPTFRLSTHTRSTHIGAQWRRETKGQDRGTDLDMGGKNVKLSMGNTLWSAA